MELFYKCRHVTTEEAVQLPCAWPSLQEARQAMFGGAAFVPDIPALQAWLGMVALEQRTSFCVGWEMAIVITSPWCATEAAWQEGYDAMGAEQLAWHVQGTKVTEAVHVLGDGSRTSAQVCCPWWAAMPSPKSRS